MRNPELTKLTILEASGKLFNVHGYKATSLSDITDATGLTKGSIYAHFENKDDLERETLEFLMHGMLAQLRVKIKGATNAPGKLRAILDFYTSYNTTNPPVYGGCPLMNAAVEADDANPELKKLVHGILEMIHRSIIRILKNGIRYGQINPELDLEYFATLVFASLEGGIMMTKITGDKKYMSQVIQHLDQEIESICS